MPGSQSVYVPIEGESEQSEPVAVINDIIRRWFLALMSIFAVWAVSGVVLGVFLQ